MSYEFGNLTTIEEVNQALEQHDALLMYFNSGSCNVGEAVAPKIMKLIAGDFPKMKFFFVDIKLSPEIAAHFSVFVEPTILTFFGGKETLRKSRHFSLDELAQAISRPYHILFD